MTDLGELRATVETLAAQVRLLQDQLEITQLVAQYGPAVDSGSGEAAAELWTEDGVFDAIPHLTMRGRAEILGMVHGTGHQSVIAGGCGHVLTAPHIVVDGDEATGRSHALHLRWDADAGRFWVFQVSANTWRWVRTERGWRIAERVNANLDGSPGPRAMLAPEGT
ncbi:nuclear transport factor 2 family protein [Streptomyces sp. NBC_00075]|uniref:Nuclear transport factor 2 family protein n=1 Tax=Streptomyces sp. NBC_00093 TaxID=2975649 RepID=A0AAU1ZZ39_9ACTN